MALKARADKRFVATLTVDGAAGRKRHFFYGATRKEATAARDEARRLAAQGVEILGPKATVGAYLTRWWKAARSSYAPRTANRWDGMVASMVDFLGARPLSMLTPTDVTAYLARLSTDGRQRARKDGQTGLAPATVAQARSVLRRALHDAQREGLVLRNAAALSRSPRVERGEPDSLTAEEAARFLATASGDRLEPLFALLTFSGLRLGEALGLRWRDLDLGDDGGVTVHRSMARIKGEDLVVDTKTGPSARTVDLHPRAVELLRAWRAAQLRERLVAGAEWKPGAVGANLVFTTPFGGPLAPWTPNKAFHGICDRADLPSRPLNVLRHTAATLMILAGVDLRVVSSALGHSNISTTSKFYAAALRPTRRDAAQRLGDLLVAAGRNA